MPLSTSQLNDRAPHPTRAVAAEARRLTLRGRVQGLGVRPALARLAQSLGLCGSVCNTADGVLIHIEGNHEDLEAFRKQLAAVLPDEALVAHRTEESAEIVGAADFRIKPNTCRGPLAAQVPPDVAVCSNCLQEVVDPGNRRFGYAFASCTRCGPRYSLIDAMPYDRQSTAMRRFQQCPRCLREYGSAADRRFHSQTNCCPDCGPRVWLGKPGGKVAARDHDAVLAAVSELRQGRVLALRGVGGYQLVVDATSSDAVRELRRRKRRAGKPLAVMVENLAAAKKLAELNDDERRALCGSTNAIVIVRAKSRGPIAPEVALGLNTLGLMLPATPLHFALSRQSAGPLVVTSGNVEGAPLAYATGAPERELAGLADCWLDHHRPIVRTIDDSVVRVIAGESATIRLARGLAPLPLDLPYRSILALGGHQKVAIALSNGAQSLLGPHVGDLDEEPARVRYLQHVESMQQLLGSRPELLVCDEHPDYFTSRWADTACWADEQRLPRLAVQHHHAHVAAAMLERGWLDREVLGVAWDGSGYGPDGTVWGGEFLLATAARYRRVAHLRSFVLPGSERAVREPWRVAVALVHQAAGAEVASQLRFAETNAQRVEQVVELLERSNSWPTTTSAGRLFDGVAALAMGVARSQFEGQPAILLESVCDETETNVYTLPVVDSAPLVLDWRPMVRAILRDVALGQAPGNIAMRFHRALATGIVDIAWRFRELPVVLCGGCFQNRVLTELVAEAFAGHRPLATPGVIPTGDGGLAAGQLAVAGARLAEGSACV